VKILLVEDHKDTRVVLTSLLLLCQYQIITADRCSEALVLLRGMNFGILLSDLMLPDGDGLDLVVQAKGLQPHLRAIAMTSRASVSERQRGRKAGFDHYLTKPFEFHELRLALEASASK